MSDHAAPKVFSCEPDPSCGNADEERVIDAEPAVRVARGRRDLEGEAGEATGFVEIKTRIPIWLHLALVSSAEANSRSLAGELRHAIKVYVEDQASR